MSRLVVEIHIWLHLQQAKRRGLMHLPLVLVMKRPLNLWQGEVMGMHLQSIMKGLLKVGPKVHEVTHGMGVLVVLLVPMAGVSRLHTEYSIQQVDRLRGS
jgi:hypothetical protein